MKRLIMTAAALALLTTAAQAQSQPKPTFTYQQGSWSVIAGPASDGAPICSLRLQGPDRALHVKYSFKRIFFVHIIKTGWSPFPAGVSIPLTYTFDQLPPTPMDAKGYIIPASGASVVEFFINPPPAASEFLERLSHSGKLIVKFTSGNEPQWISDLTGSRPAVKAFDDCMAKISAMTASKTLPFNSNTPTQTEPFPIQPQPTPTPQPFTEGPVKEAI